MTILGEIIGDEVGVEIEDPAVEVEAAIQKTVMTETVEVIGENINKGIMTTGDRDKMVLPVDIKNSGIVIMTIGIEEVTDKEIGERNGTEVEVKVTGIEVGAVDGTPMNNTLPKDIPQVHIIKILTITVHCLWDTKLRIHHQLLNTQSTHSNNTQGHFRPPDHNKHQMCASCVNQRDTTIISASLLATSCCAHRKHLTKQDHIATRII